MKDLAAREAKNNFGHLIDMARLEPVRISKHGRPVTVMLANEQYERLIFAERALMEKMTGLSAVALREKTSLLIQMKKNADVLKSIVIEYGGSHLRVFGSVAREEETIISDVDLMVDFPEGQDTRSAYHALGLGPALEAVIGRKVDIVPESGLNKYVREAALQEAIAL